MRPVSADGLYQQLEVAAAEDDLESLRAVRSKIDDFLARFPEDSRAGSVRDMQDQLKQTHPIQRAFVEAKRYVLIDPEVALAKFSALIDVYDDETIDSESIERLREASPAATRPCAKTGRRLRTRGTQAGRIADCPSG